MHPIGHRPIHKTENCCYSGPERRTQSPANADVVPVRLVRKYANAIDGVDISTAVVGDRLPLPARAAGLLLAEGWAEPAADHRRQD